MFEDIIPSGVENELNNNILKCIANNGIHE